MEYLLDGNVLGASGGFSDKRCVEVVKSDGASFWSVEVDLEERHFIKAVGFNNRNDQLAGSCRKSDPF